MEIHLAPQTGAAFVMHQGQQLRIIDPLGEQVSDLIAFALDDTREWMSSGRTLDYNETIALTTGLTLYSNRSRPMFTIVADTVGSHDFLLAPCSQEMFAILHGQSAPHPSCFENLARSLARFGIPPDAIATTFNVFMNVEIGSTGRIHVAPPRSRPGDYIDLRAEMDLVVGVTACSAEMSNNGAFKPIDVRVSDGTPIGASEQLSLSSAPAGR